MICSCERAMLPCKFGIFTLRRLMTCAQCGQFILIDCPKGDDAEYQSCFIHHLSARFLARSETLGSWWVARD